MPLGPDDLYVVPKGIEHRPAATDEVHLLLIEPVGTPNTGDVTTAAPNETISRLRGPERRTSALSAPGPRRQSLLGLRSIAFKPLPGCRA